MPVDASLRERGLPEPVLRALPAGWSPERLETLDADVEIEHGGPPLSFAEGSFDLIWSSASFTRLARGWTEWLLELRRLLSADGVLIVSLGSPALFEELTGTSWNEDEIGMTVLPRSDRGELAVFHSGWWLRAHWGRAFEVLDLGGEAERRVVLRRGRIPGSAGELALPEPGEDRELLAAQANRDQLLGLISALRDSHRRALDRQREELGRELMRKSFELAEIEWMSEAGTSPTMAVVAQYESTTSWRITRPLRAAGRFLRRLR